MLLLEHNRCCVDVAPENGFKEEEVGETRLSLYFSAWLVRLPARSRLPLDVPDLEQVGGCL